MKKIEIALIRFARFLDDICPNYFTLCIFLLCGMCALIIHKYRKKDLEDIEEQKEFDRMFNNEKIW